VTDAFGTVRLYRIITGFNGGKLISIGTVSIVNQTLKGLHQRYKGDIYMS